MLFFYAHNYNHEPSGDLAGVSKLQSKKNPKLTVTGEISIVLSNTDVEITVCCLVIYFSGLRYAKNKLLVALVLKVYTFLVVICVFTLHAIYYLWSYQFQMHEHFI